MSDRLYRRSSTPDSYVARQFYDGAVSQTVGVQAARPRDADRQQQAGGRRPEGRSADRPHLLPALGPGRMGEERQRGESRTEERRNEPTEPSPAEKALAQLLYAIALEEVAMARLINQEMEKAVQAARHTAGEASFDEVLALHRSAADVIHNVARKEELLAAKLSTVLGIAEVMAAGRGGAYLEAEGEEPVWGHRDTLYAERHGDEHTLAK